ncbi:MAG TPA: VanW family protein [Candidatus Saccharimonadales bacterium]|nr:VanW family protein [Candidatus Saccharimonadales bacterium]
MVTNILAMSLFGLASINPFAQPTAMPQAQPQVQILAKSDFSLADRYPVKSVSDVFKDNILLTLQYMEGDVDPKHVSWEAVEKPFTYSFTLKPKETFAFHKDVLPQYQDSLVKTTNADFSSDQGFKSDGYLVGDGVCHLASFINVAAKAAKLDVYAPTNHNFAVIPDVAKEDGVAIYDTPDNKAASEQQNLYITNNQDKPVEFTFTYKDDMLEISITEENSSI